MREPAVARDGVENDLASLKVEPKIELPQAGSTHGLTDLVLFLFTVQQQEASATRTGNLPSNRSILLREPIPGVNPWIRDPTRELLLQLVELNVTSFFREPLGGGLILQ